jgi:predicted transcriptional regulator
LRREIIFQSSLKERSIVTIPRYYRERIYIVKDIILKLVEYGELNQTALISCCGLNFKKHSPILDKLESKGLIRRHQMEMGKRVVTTYSPTQQGVEFSKHILEPYEIMFPRNDLITVEPTFLLMLYLI